MKSPLLIYKEIAKKFKITEDKNVPAVARLSFARTQANEQAQIVNRLLFDIATAYTQLETAKDDMTKSAIQSKATGFENDLRQLSAALDVSNAIVKEFEDELAKEAK